MKYDGRTVFHLFDGDEWRQYSDLKDASREAGNLIDIASDACDPEWPDWVNDIVIYEAEPDCEMPDEDGRIILTSQECNHQKAPDGFDYYCEYIMDSPPQDIAEKGEVRNEDII